MGMYTEIYVKVRLKEDVPEQVVDILKFMMGMQEGLQVPTPLPDHELFTTPRWDFMLRCCSHYHIPQVVGQFWFNEIANQWFLVNRSDFKNYSGEAALFFDWLEPYVEINYDRPTLVGYTLYEEAYEPELVFYGGVNK